MQKLIISFFCLFCFILTTYVQAQQEGLSDKNYRIYSVIKKKKVDINAIVNDFKDYDVIFFGEEHNDSVAHYLQNLLFEKFYEAYNDKMALSMEMFTRDVQFILDEYLDGHINEKYFRKESNVWSNYKNDYRPMVEFAKEKKLDVIAANAAFRYTNVASNKGMEALYELSDEAKNHIAPLPYDTATGAYYDKLMSMFGYAIRHTMNDTAKKTPSMPIKMPNMILGQSLWDATMAYSIHEYLEKNPGKKIMHLNGKFHSDEYFGIIPQLKKYHPGIKILVISSHLDRTKKFPRIKFKNYANLGDYIIVTDPSVPPTYDY